MSQEAIAAVAAALIVRGVPLHQVPAQAVLLANNLLSISNCPLEKWPEIEERLARTFPPTPVATQASPT